MNKLAVDETNLQLEPYDLYNTLFFILALIEVVLAVLGVVALILLEDHK